MKVIVMIINITKQASFLANNLSLTIKRHLRNTKSLIVKVKTTALIAVFTKVTNMVQLIRAAITLNGMKSITALKLKYIILTPLRRNPLRLKLHVLMRMKNPITNITIGF